MPDDISELADEVALLRSEQPQARPAGAVRRVLRTPHRGRFGGWGPLIIIVALVVLFFASLVFLLAPATPRPPQAHPLAAPRVGVGRPGGLMPDLALPVGATRAIRLRSLRPAVVLLLPTGCRCRALVDDVILSTSPARLQVLLVGPAADPPLPRSAPTQRAYAGTDSGGRLGAAFGLAGQPVAVFVRSDGTVARVLRGAVAGAEVHDEVAGLAG